MKLILCLACQDVVKLDTEVRSCKCGESSGKYLDNKLHAKISGQCVVLGLDNHTLSHAIRRRENVKTDREREFVAFVFPEGHERVERVESV